MIALEKNLEDHGICAPKIFLYVTEIICIVVKIYFYTFLKHIDIKQGTLLEHLQKTGLKKETEWMKNTKRMDKTRLQS